jgi:integrase
LCRRRHKHQLRHAHAVELARESVPLPILQRQLEHRNMVTTRTYLSGIATAEVIATVASRRPYRDRFRG